MLVVPQYCVDPDEVVSTQAGTGMVSQKQFGRDSRPQAGRNLKERMWTVVTTALSAFAYVFFASLLRTNSCAYRSTELHLFDRTVELSHMVFFIKLHFNIPTLPFGIDRCILSLNYFRPLLDQKTSRESFTKM